MLRLVYLYIIRSLVKNFFSFFLILKNHVTSNPVEKIKKSVHKSQLQKDLVQFHHF